ncbi:MAG TPA: RNA 2',3'-cyclic phosphodiesterase [Pyrinomonadaceae bacterium]|nr:RNA 2',3'-cyclic phosphodiesterase [Pyrinomonadaceae bacterium]
MNTKHETWRVFCAFGLPPEVRMRLIEHMAQLRNLFPQVRASWNRDENIHLTLKFLGETPVERVSKLDEAISRAVVGLEPFPIVISGTGVFPRPRDPRVLWIGVSDATGSLAKVQSRLEHESEQEGFPKEVRQFHPHLTVARLRTQQRARELAQAHLDLKFASEEILVTELLLIRSELSSQGSRYTTISRHQLKG